MTGNANIGCELKIMKSAIKRVPQYLNARPQSGSADKDLKIDFNPGARFLDAGL